MMGKMKFRTFVHLVVVLGLFVPCNELRQRKNLQVQAILPMKRCPQMLSWLVQGTGVAAATIAAQLGLDVILLEKLPYTGGTFIGSEGLFALERHCKKNRVSI